MTSAGNTISSPPEPGAANREWRAVLLLLLLTIAVWIPYRHTMRYMALKDPDAQDYAQIARNVYEGQGFKTDVMPLCGLVWRQETGRQGAPWWNVHRFPFPSAVQAALFHIIGPTDLAVSLSSALFFFATIPLLFAFARRLFPFRVAFLATFLFALSGGEFKTSISGLTEPAAIFFFLATLYLVVWPRGSWSYGLAGALTGVAFLNRYSIVLYALPLLFWIFKTSKRPYLHLASFILPAAIVVAPWLVRTYLIAGDPLFSLTSALMARYLSLASPRTHDWYQFVYVKPSEFWLGHPGWTLLKWVKMTADLWWFKITTIGTMGWLFTFFVVDILRPYNGLAARLRRFLLATFILHFLTFGLLSNIARYYAVFTPFLYLFAADAIVWIIAALHPTLTKGQKWMALFFLVPMLFKWATIAGPPERPKEHDTWVEWQPDNQKWIRENTPADALIVSDVPWSVAWFADRRSVPIPPTPDDMNRFREFNLQPDGIYLMSPHLRMGVPEGWDKWREVRFGGTTIPGYRVAAVLKGQAVYLERIPASQRLAGQALSRAREKLPLK